MLICNHSSVVLTLTFLKGQDSYSVNSPWIWSVCCCLMMRFKFCIFGRNTTEVTSCPLLSIVSRGTECPSVSLLAMLILAQSGVFHCKVSTFPFIVEGKHVWRRKRCPFFPICLFIYQLKFSGPLVNSVGHFSPYLTLMLRLPWIWQFTGAFSPHQWALKCLGSAGTC